MHLLQIVDFNRMGEQLCNSYTKTYGLETVCLRFFNVYGPHQDFRRKHPPFLGYVIRELLAGRPPMLHGTGEQRRDYVYVSDLIDLVKRALLLPVASGHVFNVASGQHYSVNELYDLVAKALKTSKSIRPHYRSPAHFWEAYPELASGPMPLPEKVVFDEVNKFAHGSFQKAKEMLGWEPKTSIESGIQATVDYAVRMSESKGDGAHVALSPNASPIVESK